MFTTIIVSIAFMAMLVLVGGCYIMIRDHTWGVRIPLSDIAPWLNEIAIGFRNARIVVRMPDAMMRRDCVQIRKIFPSDGLAYLMAEVHVSQRRPDVGHLCDLFRSMEMSESPGRQGRNVIVMSRNCCRDLTAAADLTVACLVRGWGADPHTVVRVRRIGLFRLSQPDVPNWDMPLESLGSIVRRWTRP